MLLDLDFISARRRLEVRRIAFEGSGEVSTEVIIDDLRFPVRLNITHGFLVVTIISSAHPNETARWIERFTPNSTWRRLSRRWDDTGEDWSCTVRISPP